MGNPFVHIELQTGDVAKAKKFYKSLFDWKLTDTTEPMPYTLLEVGPMGAPGAGGGMTRGQNGAPPMWLPYVQVDDVKKTIAKAQKGGATILMPFMEIGQMGAIGVFVDPVGAPIGVWAAAKSPPAAKAAPAKKPAPAKKAAAKPAKKPAKKK
jgi:predicted enzyme related to lactoylglutathione lyase